MEFVELTGWVMLAVGAALAIGTGAALVSYRREGTFPGQPADPAGDDGPPMRTRLTYAVAKVLLGLVLALGGVGVLLTRT